MSEMALWHDEPIDDHIKPVLSSMPLRRVEDVRATDIILCPSMAWGIEDVDKIKQLARPYHELGLKYDKVVLLFVVTDTEEPVCFEAGRTLVYRIGLTKRNRSYGEFALPYAWENSATPYAPKPRTGRAVIGFCGYAESHPVRAETIASLAVDLRFRADFVIRDKFWGGKPHDETLKGDFFRNISESHFSICDRGKGNFSMRLYQVLSCGRIPALVDTGAVLPDTRGLKWKDVIVMGRNPKDLADKIDHFYATRDMDDAQAQCRVFVDENLSPEGFGINLTAHLTESVARAREGGPFPTSPARARVISAVRRWLKPTTFGR